MTNFRYTEPNSKNFIKMQAYLIDNCSILQGASTEDMNKEYLNPGSHVHGEDAAPRPSEKCKAVEMRRARRKVKRNGISFQLFGLLRWIGFLKPANAGFIYTTCNNRYYI